MENYFSKNMSDEKKDKLFLYACGKLKVDTENDVLVDVVIELEAEIQELKKKLEFKEKEAEHYKSMFYGKQKSKDKIRDINIITINNNFNNTFNSFDSEDGDDECGMAEDMDQA